MKADQLASRGLEVKVGGSVGSVVFVGGIEVAVASTVIVSTTDGGSVGDAPVEQAVLNKITIINTMNSRLSLFISLRRLFGF